MDKETTPQTHAAWKASIDDTGCICRMEPIWETMENLEKMNQLLAAALKNCIYGKFNATPDGLELLAKLSRHNETSPSVGDIEKP